MTDHPLGWALAKLADLAEVIDPNPSHRNPKYVASGFPFISTAEFAEPDCISLDTRNQVGEQTVREQEERCGFTARSIAFARKGTIGTTRCLPSRCRFALLDSLCVINASDSVLPKYLRYAIASPATQARIFASARGVALQQLSVGAVREIVVPVAPPPQQRRIVDKLDSLIPRVNACRQRLDRVPGILKRFRQSVLAAGTSGELTREWRDERGYQEAWPEVTLESVATDFSYGSAAKSSQSGSVPVLRMGNIQEGTLDWTNLVFTSGVQEIAKYRLSPGDVLFNRTNSPELVGKTAVFRGEREAIYAGYLIRVRCGEKLLPDYLNYCLGSPAGRDYCWQVKSDGVSQSNINATKLAAFTFALPSVEEQREIVRRVEDLLAANRALESRVKRTSAVAGSLVPAILGKAFRGDLVPQDPNDEPAEVMLERIRAERVTQKKAEVAPRRRPRANAKRRGAARKVRAS